MFRAGVLLIFFLADWIDTTPCYPIDMTRPKGRYLLGARRSMQLLCFTTMQTDISMSGSETARPLPNRRHGETTSILPALQVRTQRSGLFHVFHHLWKVVLVQADRRVVISRITMRLAHAEVEGGVKKRIRRCVQVIL